MQSGRAHGNQNIAVANLVWSEKLVCFDNADSGGGNIVVIFIHYAWVLSGLATKKCTACLHAALSNTGNNLRNLFRNNLAYCDVVLEK